MKPRKEKRLHICTAAVHKHFLKNLRIEKSLAALLGGRIAKNPVNRFWIYDRIPACRINAVPIRLR